MTDTPISQTDIDGLAGKLDQLDPTQKAMLSAILTLAKEKIATAPEVEGKRLDAVSFREQFEGAFTAGRRAAFRETPGGGKVVVFKISR